MVLYGSFRSKDDKLYHVEISEGSGESVEVKLGAKPAVISTSSDSLFAPIKSRSLSIEVFTKDWYFDLYSPTARGVTVKLYDDDNKVLFRGFLTPAAYDQTFTYVDTITLEAVDGISSSKEFDFVNDGTYKSFFDLVIPILRSCGYRGSVYVPNTYININNKLLEDNILKELFASSGNFVDDDEAHTAWKEYDVIFEVMQFLGWSLVPDGDDVWMVDYKGEANGSVSYSVYDIQSGNRVQVYDSQIGEYVDYIYDSPSAPTPIILDDMAPGESTIQIDDVYNKIEISDNLYKIEEVSPDVNDDAYHISVTDEIQAKDGITGLNVTKWTKTSTKGILWWKDTKTTTTGHYYQTLCRLRPESGWKHKYYKMRDLTPIPEPEEYDPETDTRYYDPDSESIYVNGIINKYVNTHCCMIQHYAYLKNNGENNLPPNIDWTDALTFFVLDDTINGGTGKIGFADMENYQLPVLEYNIDEEIIWKAFSGTSWITIKGDLFYQYNGAKYGEKKRKKNTLNVINQDQRYYFTAPVDKIDQVPDADLFSFSRSKSNDAYGKGFPMWKFKLQIGEGEDARWWNGEDWTKNESEFYVNYNNNPTDGDDEVMPAFEWVSPVNNRDFKDKVGVDGYAIPITGKYAPVKGKMKLTVYTPAIAPTNILSFMKQLFPNSYKAANWYDLTPMIFAKDFEVGYVYTDTTVWWNNHDADTNKDKVYVGYIDDNYVQNFDALQFKLNTATIDTPISRSFVTTKDGYLETMQHMCSDEAKIQEYNVIDEYLDHHSDEKVILDRNMHGHFKPNEKFSKNNLDGVFLIDSQSYDIREDNNQVKYIAY